MARAAKATTAPAPESASREIVNWDEQLARDAEIAAGIEKNVGGGQFFSTQAGILSIGGVAMPDNQMPVIISDHILENVFYADAYDSTSPAAPVCFAFGRDENEMRPHETVFAHKQEQSPQCPGCPMNAWGTAEKGKGKACRNIRRLALIPAGEMDREGRFQPFTDPEDFASSSLAFLKVPVMSVKGYAGFVKSLAASMKRPPHGVFTLIKVVPDARSQFRVTFTPLGPVPNDVMSAVMARHKEAASAIEFPYNLDALDAPAQAGAANRTKAATAAPGRPAVKRGGKY